VNVRAPRSIGIAGSGRAARALGAALAEGGQAATLIWSRDATKGRDAAREARAGRFEPSLPAFLGGAELVLVAVADAAVEPLAAEMADALESSSGADAGPRIVLHLAGARTSAALHPLRRRGAACGVFHPVAVLTGAASADALRGAVITISGDAAAVEAARALAHVVDAAPAEVDDASRTLLHAGAVMAAGHVVTLLHLAERLVRDTGVQPRLARRLVTSLAASAVRAHADGGLAGGITGPLPRGDLATLSEHLRALGDRAEVDPEALAAYRALLRAGARALLDAGATDSDLAARVDALLDAEDGSTFAGDGSD
jgi:predicted short-subunit dehydrogenase-like oxidoreductase (DUF2520 family)